MSSEGELQLPPSRTSESWREGTNSHARARTHTHTHTHTHTRVWLLPAQRYRAATHQNCNTAASSWKSHSEAKDKRKRRDIELTTGIRGCCALLELEYFNPTEQFAYEALHSFFIGLVDQVMIALIGRPLSTYVVAPNHRRRRAQRRSTHRGEGCMAFSLSLSLCVSLCLSLSLSLVERPLPRNPAAVAHLLACSHQLRSSAFMSCSAMYIGPLDCLISAVLRIPTRASLVRHLRTGRASVICSDAHV